MRRQADISRKGGYTVTPVSHYDNYQDFEIKKGQFNDDRIVCAIMK